MAHPKRMLALGAICTTAIFRVPEIPRPPAKVLATQRCTVVDGWPSLPPVPFKN